MLHLLLDTIDRQAHEVASHAIRNIDGPLGAHGIDRTMVETFSPLLAYLVGVRIGAYLAATGRTNITALDGAEPLRFRIVPRDSKIVQGPS